MREIKGYKNWRDILVLFIYRTINSFFGDILKQYGFILVKPIKSNIHPSVLYRSDNKKCEVQVGYNYEEDVPFINIYGKRTNAPVYQNTGEHISPSKKLILFSKSVEEFLQNNT